MKGTHQIRPYMKGYRQKMSYECRYLCQICKITPIFDQDGPLLGASEKCECCGQHVCRGCAFIDIDFWLGKHSDIPDHIKNALDISWDVVCNTCMQNIEKDYIDEVPPQDLPLFVNHEWYFPETTLPYFKDKLCKQS